MDIITILIKNIIQVYTCCCFFDIKHGRNTFSKRMFNIILVIICILKTVFHLIVDQNIVFEAITLVLLVFAISTLLYDYQIKRMIFYNVFCIIYFYLIEILTMRLLGIASDGLDAPVPDFISALLASVLITCTFSVFLGICNTRINKINLSFIIYSVLFLYMGILETLVILILFYKLYNQQIFLLILSWGFLILNLCLHLHYQYLAERLNLKENPNLNLKYQKFTEKHYQELEAEQMRLRKIFHDFKKHTDVVEALDLGEARQYLDNLYKNIDQGYKEFKTDNKILRIILSQMVEQCRENEIEIDLQIQDTKLDHMDDLDITILFYNLFINAIEACMECPKGKRSILFRMNTYYDNIVINMKNTSISVPVKKSKIFQSTKQGHMGIGISNIKEVVEKYSGNISFVNTRDYFEVHIFILANLK